VSVCTIDRLASRRVQTEASAVVPTVVGDGLDSHRETTIY